MKPRLRRCDPALRNLWIALLLLVVGFNPALVAASEVHESAHLLQLSHSHSLDADEHSPNLADEPDPTEGSGQWHALMHLGHCCGHPTALVPMALAVAALPRATPPGIAGSVTWPSVGRTRLLRPPIVR